MKQRILLADDHEFFRLGVKTQLEMEDFIVVGEAGNGKELLEVSEKKEFDVLILDYKMPLFNLFHAIPKLKSLPFKFKIILLSGTIDKHLFKKCSKHELDGIILKDEPISELINAINIVLKGKKYFTEYFLSESEIENGFNDPINALTSTEKNILRLMSSGYKLKDIADFLKIQINTVDVHKRNIKKKLGVKSNAELIKIALENNVV
ncbi:MAG TPA: response regulator transcription factor [Leptospiraceae bacterium]|nr:response regulator transcription factor [Leptospiraceae bacterium]HRG76411.1 response regulator transcription factor [Leptospiraceae bacterium]